MHGPSESNKWNSFNWGETYWGASIDPDFTLVKYIFEGVSAADNVIKRFTRTLDGGSFSASDDTVSGLVGDGAGNYYEFMGGGRDFDQRDDKTAWNESSDSATSWTAATDSDTEWS
jgi:hypothetical protein